MTKHPYDILTLDNGAKLIFTPCPGTKSESLMESIATLKAAGTSMLITLMYDEEMEKNQAQALPDFCEEQGVQWMQLPLPDDAAPNEDFARAWQTNRQVILDKVANKGTIAVHCKGGSGRTGLVIGLIMKALGLPVSEIKQQVQALRPKALVNPSQLTFFERFNG
ncbi:tyrosine-protein phosphatase [Thalassotalea euphylliae]|uniref:phosphatase domain-containing protein n=1 Tax=Thalassotalea euphylliae TaxID=1655234 RepID=UPI00362D81B3